MAVIRISCVGDLLPADTAYTMGNGIGSNMKRLIEYYSKSENNPFQNSDAVFCNLEAPLILNHDRIKLPFEGNPEVIRLMKILNISVVSIANNHIYDHGLEGFNQTTNLLDENGFLYIGSSLERGSKIGWLKCKDKKIAVASFNAINDHPEFKLIAALERNVLFKTLDEIKKQSPDYIIFSVHWGDEYVTWPSPSQSDLAHELIDKGVNIIIGHHPHVVQPVEKYHDGIILYSLGNFLFDMFWSKNVRQGMYVDLVLNEDKSIDYHIKPYRIQSNFAQDYTNKKGIISNLAKSDKILEILQSGPRETYQKKYLSECRKRRMFARLRMKLYLLKHLFRLSSQSKRLLYSNIKIKSGF